MAKSRTIVGLDIGGHAVKAVWTVKRPGGYAVTRREILHLPLSDGNPMRIVKPWLEKHGISKLPVALGLAGSNCVIQTVLYPGDDPRTPAQAAGMEVDKFNDIASEQMNFGYATAHVAEDDRRLLLVMAKPNFVNEALELGPRLGVTVAEVVPIPVALYNGRVGTLGKDESVTAWVDVGHTATCVAIGDSKGLWFARVFATGGAAFTEALQSGNGLSASQADNLKMTSGALGMPDDERSTKLATVADRWLSELRSVMGSFRSQFRGYELGHIELVGGGALLSGLVDRVAEEFTLPVSQGAPASQAGRQDASDLFAVAEGAAATAQNSAVSQLSLLPEYVRDELVFREKKPYWIATGGAAALALAVFILGGLRSIGVAQKTLRKQEQELKQLNKLADRIDAADREIRNLLTRAEPVTILLEWGPRSRELITLVAKSLDPEDWISMVCDRRSYQTRPPGAETPATGRRTRLTSGLRDRRLASGVRRDKPDAESVMAARRPLSREFIVEGYTREPNLSTVRDLIRRLEADEMVEYADVIADDHLQEAGIFRAQPSDAALKLFTIEVRIKEAR
jgi:Tfp pilus assembly PilM family ATPase